MAKWVTDFRHGPSVDAPGLAAEGARRAAFVRDVVEAATAMCEVDGRWLSALRCIAKRAGRACGGGVEVGALDEAHTVEWRCRACGDEGVVTGFADGEHDLSMYVPSVDSPEVVQWRVDEPERALLWRASAELPHVRAVIVRASPLPELPDVFAAPAYKEELDEIYTLVEELSDVVRSRREREVLDGLRASLSVAMDGF